MSRFTLKAGFIALLHVIMRHEASPHQSLISGCYQLPLRPCFWIWDAAGSGDKVAAAVWHCMVDVFALAGVWWTITGERYTKSKNGTEDRNEASLFRGSTIRAVSSLSTAKRLL